MFLIKLLLLPISFLYGTVMEIRNLCFRLNILKVYQLPCKVISVGNLSLGGTGKTPFVIGLIEALEESFKHIVVLSRGYGRNSKGAHVVSLKGNLLVSTDIAGDEPYLIAKRFSSITVVVAEKRIEGFRLIENEKPDLVILDDGFQHQYMKRDFNILLMNGNEPYNKDAVIPAGRLREFKFNISRANILVETKKNSNSYSGSLPYFFAPYKNEELNKIEELEKSSPVVLVSGIAKPDSFEMTIKNKGINFTSHLRFNDHHNYSYSDFSKLNSSDIILTTEKDYYKLLELHLENEIRCVKIDFDLSNELINYVKKQILKPIV